jgi:hypothetical protein
MQSCHGSGSAQVGPGMGPGLASPQNPRKTSVGPGGSGWSGSVTLSFVAAGSRITHDARVTRDARIGGYRECRGKTRTHPDHPDPWRFSADFQQRRPGPNPDPHLDPPGPTGPNAREVPRRARAPPSRVGRQRGGLGAEERRPEYDAATPTSLTGLRVKAAVPSGRLRNAGGRRAKHRQRQARFLGSQATRQPIADPPKAARNPCFSDRTPWTLEPARSPEARQHAEAITPRRPDSSKHGGGDYKLFPWVLRNARVGACSRGYAEDQY